MKQTIDIIVGVIIGVLVQMLVKLKRVLDVRKKIKEIDSKVNSAELSDVVDDANKRRRARDTNSPKG